MGGEGQLCELNSPLVLFFSEAVCRVALFCESFTPIARSLVCCTFFALRVLGDPCVVLYHPSKTLRVHILPWLVRGCQSSACPSWDLCKICPIASLRQAAQPCGEEQPFLSHLIVSGKLQVNGSVNLQKELSQAQSTNQKEQVLSEVQLPTTQAGWWDLQGS